MRKPRESQADTTESLRERLRDERADVVRDDTEALPAARVGQFQQVRRVAIRTGVAARGEHRRLRVAETAKIGREQLESVREPAHDRTPRMRPLRPAVQQEERRAAAGMCPHPVDGASCRAPK